MKPKTTSIFIKIVFSICTIFISYFNSFAQSSKEIFAILDTTDFNGKPLLNKTIRTSTFFDGFREGKKKSIYS